MSDEILKAIDKLGADLRAEIVQSRAETSALVEGLHTAIDGIREDLTVLGGMNDRVRKAGDNVRDEVRDLATGLANVERLLRKHGTRLDDLDRRVSRKPDGE